MRAAVFYATREGQARHVAEHVAASLRAHGFETDVIDVRRLYGRVDWAAYQTALVVASVHVGHHEREMRRFVERYRDELHNIPAAFLSLTLSQAGAQDPGAPREKRDLAHADAVKMIDVFAAETGWLPARSLTVAGALAYTKYGFLTKLIMKRIARKAGASTDTSRDHEFTDWQAVDDFVLQHVGLARAS